MTEMLLCYLKARELNSVQGLFGGEGFLGWQLSSTHLFLLGALTFLCDLKTPVETTLLFYVRHSLQVSLKLTDHLLLINQSITVY